MAPTPDVNTYKVWIQYTHGGYGHELLLRFNEDPRINTDVQSMIDQIIGAMLPCLNEDDAVTGGRISTPGNPISFPYAPLTGPGTYVGGAATQEDRATFTGLSARSVLGVEATFHLFCAAATPFTLYRVPAADVPTPISTWRAEMTQINGDARLVAVDGQNLFFRGYSNFGQNAYWQREQR